MESVILEYRIQKLELEINKIRMRIAIQKNEVIIKCLEVEIKLTLSQSFAGSN